MFKYLLTKQVLVDVYQDHSTAWGRLETLGTFDEIDNVNDFLSSSGYPDHIKFISCKQIIESKMNNRATRLTLTSVPLNPIDKIGELCNAFKEEESVLDLRCAMDQASDDMIADEDMHYVVEPRFLGGELFLNFCQFGISLLKDGTWMYEYTGYGSDLDSEDGCD